MSETEMSETVACALLTAHTPVHTAPSLLGSATSGPKLERPKVDVGLNEEEWNVFERRWDAFVAGSRLNPADCSSQLFQCAGEALGDMLLKSDPKIISKPTAEVKASMKSMAVIAVATGVIRTELVAMSQNRDETFRAFAARVRGKAETCGYTIACTCGSKVDFTEVIIRDVLIAGISDMDIRREVLGTKDILSTSINDVITLVESKEMARNALPPSNAGISGYRRQNKSLPDKNKTSACPDCNKKFNLFTENANGWNKKPHPCCLDCFRARRMKNRKEKSQDQNAKDNSQDQSGSGSSDIGSIFSQVSAVTSKALVPCHHIFTKSGWRKAKLLSHPKVSIFVSALRSDYKAFGVQCQDTSSTQLSGMTDSGAQSCLWSYDEFRSAGFTKEYLLPVQMNLTAANKSPIKIEGAALLRLSGAAPDGSVVTCAAMVYISSQAKGFFLSREAMIDLGIISSSFPYQIVCILEENAAAFVRRKNDDVM